jgi:pantoate--beta-alanine ligase
MRLAADRAQLRPILRAWRQAGRSVALVPTMGNLHAGHLALVEAARRAADCVVCSIYVNPTQFGPGEDYRRYPRTFDADRARLEAAGCDLLFHPDDATMYPGGQDDATRLCAAPSLANVLEGARRPGHFDGVVTVVARLFNLVGPDVAVFGEKDYQQLLVIRRMVNDLAFPLRILPVATVRAPDGLALSSRNGYLDDRQRALAVGLSRALDDTIERLRTDAADVAGAEQAACAALGAQGFRVDYVSVRRAADLAPPGPGDTDLRVLAAVWCGNTRLIDNRPLLPG